MFKNTGSKVNVTDIKNFIPVYFSRSYLIQQGKYFPFINIFLYIISYHCKFTANTKLLLPYKGLTISKFYLLHLYKLVDIVCVDRRTTMCVPPVRAGHGRGAYGGGVSSGLGSHCALAHLTLQLHVAAASWYVLILFF